MLRSFSATGHWKEDILKDYVAILNELLAEQIDGIGPRGKCFSRVIIAVLNEETRSAVAGPTQGWLETVSSSVKGLKRAFHDMVNDRF